MTIDDILAQAQERAQDEGYLYDGCLTPEEAWQLVQQHPQARLVDVRTLPEWQFVGRVPSGLHVEWQSWPDGRLNAHFLQELQTAVPRDALVLFLCRSGQRSHDAATLACQEGWACYNVLEGFEGALDSAHHRGYAEGWQARGLPWVQS